MQFCLTSQYSYFVLGGSTPQVVSPTSPQEGSDSIKFQDGPTTTATLPPDTLPPATTTKWSPTTTTTLSLTMTNPIDFGSQSFETESVANTQVIEVDNTIF